MLNSKKRESYRWGDMHGEWSDFATEEKDFQVITEQEIISYIIEKLGYLGDKKALNPLIQVVDENDINIVANSLVKIVKKNKLENSKEILKFLKSNDEGMKRMGTSMLKGILEA